MAIPESVALLFSRQFDILLADNESLRRRVYQVRHRVFCQELGFAMKNFDGFETDEYDSRSLHILLRDRISGTDIACIRVVEPRSRGGGLPFESFALRHVDRKLLDWKQLDSTQCCEFSRLAALQSVRRVSGQKLDISESQQDTKVAKDLRSLIPVALSYAGLALALSCDYEWIFMGGEPRLQRLITRCGIYSQQISPLFDYYGRRALFALSRTQLLTDMQRWKPEWLELYQYIDNKLTSNGADTAVARAG